jgi:hypothetical protein
MTALTLGVLAACNSGQPYGGANCNALTVPRSIEGLSIRAPSPVPANFYEWSDPLVAASEELKCCAGTTLWSGPPDHPERCPAVDCEALRTALTIGDLGVPFVGEPCGNGGSNRCRAVMKGDQVIGVSSFCFD